jgi:hypothetical protein
LGLQHAAPAQAICLVGGGIGIFAVTSFALLVIEFAQYLARSFGLSVLCWKLFFLFALMYPITEG